MAIRAYCQMAVFCAVATVSAAPVIFDVNDPGPIADRVAFTEPALTEFHFTVGTAGNVGDIDLQLSIAHPDLFDLDIYLKSPAGTIVNLLAGIDDGPNLQDTRLDDSAGGSIGVSGSAPFKGPDHVGGTSYRPKFYANGANLRLSHFNGETAAGTWTLQVFDVFSSATGTLYSSGQAAPWGTAAGTKLFVTIQGAGTSVVARKIFYNNSSYDGNNAAANTSDDSAIATDKTALRPGETATFANYTGFSKGITGIMLDISGLAGIPTVNDFTFRVGNDSNPAGWTTTLAPTMLIRNGAGTSGSTRIHFVWANNVIQNQWLQVTTLATANTGLAANDVCYFGNAIGECTGNRTVNVQDIGLTRQVAGQNVGITSVYDHDRSGLINVVDIGRVRGNAGFTLALLVAP